MRRFGLIVAIIFCAGVAQAQVPKAIYKGIETGMGQWEEVVRVSLGDAICTGTLISPRVVLLAAHCLTPVNDKSEIQVWWDFGDSPALITIETYGVHPDYCGAPDCADEAFDFAYLLLEDNIYLEDGYPILNNNSSSEMVQLAVDDTLHIVGYGLKSHESILSGNVKRMTSTSVKAISPRQHQFGAGDYDGDGCFGDSGGPAFVCGDDDTWRLVGVLSSGTTDRCGTGSYYGSVSSIEDWLSAEIGYKSAAQKQNKQSCSATLEEMTADYSCSITAYKSPQRNKSLLTLLGLLFG